MSYFTHGECDITRKPVVMALIEKLGFEAIDAGPLRIARLLEAYGMPWIGRVTIMKDGGGVGNLS